MYIRLVLESAHYENNLKSWEGESLGGWFCSLRFISALKIFKVDLEFKSSCFSKEIYYVKLNICGLKLFLNSSKKLLPWTSESM